MEEVVLLDESGRAAGVMDKAAVHTTATQLHLAFSCYVFNRSGELLITQRAHGKSTWPGVWTNTCCGHPAPSEQLPEAVSRRVHQELGIEVERVSLILPRFRYRAVMPNGIVENEMCPVYWAVTDSPVRPDPDEVADTRWVDWGSFAADVLAGRTAVSPWCAEQVPQLNALGPTPATWPGSGADQLPVAAR